MKKPVGVEVRYEINPGEDLRDQVGSVVLRPCTGDLARACTVYDPGHCVPRFSIRPVDSVSSVVFWLGSITPAGSEVSVTIGSILAR